MGKFFLDAPQLLLHFLIRRHCRKLLVECALRIQFFSDALGHAFNKPQLFRQGKLIDAFSDLGQCRQVHHAFSQGELS
jgi:hypothetical protein